VNRKGFTLIELLAVIILIAIIAVLIVPSVLNSAEKSKEASYNMMIKNIITASELYYQECEYGDLSNEDKYGGYKCTINGNNIETSLGTLANTGMLKVNNLDDDDKKIVINPKTKEDISSCDIIIEKSSEEITDDNNIKHKKITYIVKGNTTDEKCPYQTNEVYGSE